jgi:hypothetical protein
MSLLKNTIKNEYVKARKGNDPKYKTLSLLLAAIKQVEIDQKKELTDQNIIKILKTESKKRKEAIADYQKADRKDLELKEKNELNIIKQYLPQEINEKELIKIIEKEINSTPQSRRNMGTIMNKIMSNPNLQNRIEGSLAAKIIKQKLNNL